MRVRDAWTYLANAGPGKRKDAVFLAQLIARGDDSACWFNRLIGVAAQMFVRHAHALFAPIGQVRSSMSRVAEAVDHKKCRDVKLSSPAGRRNQGEGPGCCMYARGAVLAQPSTPEAEGRPIAERLYSVVFTCVRTSPPCQLQLLRHTQAYIYARKQQSNGPVA